MTTRGETPQPFPTGLSPRRHDGCSSSRKATALLARRAWPKVRRRERLANGLRVEINRHVVVAPSADRLDR